MKALRVFLAAAVLTSCSAGAPTGSTDVPAGGSFVGHRVFPADNAWNTDISGASVDRASATLIAACGVRNLHPDFGTIYGIPYVLVGSQQPLVPVSFDYASESDPGPYPVPPNAPIEGGAASTGDRHVIVVDTAHSKLYELYDSHLLSGGASWHAGAGAVFDLTSNALRPLYWTSADAAGLPIFPGLVRYDEAVEAGAINHAIRFTCPTTQRGFIAPARHYASSDTSSGLPPMGMRVRLKSSYNVSGFPAEAQAILKAMKVYGMILADNGSGWFFTGAPDTRWNDENLSTLKGVPSSAFEVVRMGPVTH